eukprot:SAG31_NODE_24870_length_472_cov_10.911528_1_plen_25_part_10
MPGEQDFVDVYTALRKSGTWTGAGH